MQKIQIFLFLDLYKSTQKIQKNQKLVVIFQIYLQKYYFLVNKIPSAYQEHKTLQKEVKNLQAFYIKQGDIKRCPMYQFQKYLQDMDYARIYIVDKRNSKYIGVSYVDFQDKLFKKINGQQNQVFENFIQMLSIYKLPTVTEPKLFSKQIGQIKVEFVNNFDQSLYSNLDDEPVMMSKYANQDQQIENIYKNPFSRFFENQQKDNIENNNICQFELDTLIQKTQNIVNEIDTEINQNECDFNDNQDSKNIHNPEIELELMKLKNMQRKVDIQIEQSQNNSQLQTSMQNSSTKILKLNIKEMKILYKQYLKIFDKGILFLSISINQEKQKVLLKYSKDNEIFDIDKQIIFKLDFTTPDQAQQTWNSELKFGLIFKELDNKKKSKQLGHSQRKIAQSNFKLSEILLQQNNTINKKLLQFKLKKPNCKSKVVLQNMQNLQKMQYNDNFSQMLIQYECLNQQQQPKEQIQINNKEKVFVELEVLLKITEIQNIKINEDEYIVVECIGLQLNRKFIQVLQIETLGQDYFYKVKFDCRFLITQEFFKQPKDLLLQFIKKNRTQNTQQFLGTVLFNKDVFLQRFLQDNNLCLQYYQNFNNCLSLQKGFYEVKNFSNQSTCLINLELYIGKSNILDDFQLKQEQNLIIQQHSNYVQSFEDKKINIDSENYDYNTQNSGIQYFPEKEQQQIQKDCSSINHNNKINVRQSNQNFTNINSSQFYKTENNITQQISDEEPSKTIPPEPENTSQNIQILKHKKLISKSEKFNKSHQILNYKNNYSNHVQEDNMKIQDQDFLFKSKLEQFQDIQQIYNIANFLKDIANQKQKTNEINQNQFQIILYKYNLSDLSEIFCSQIYQNDKIYLSIFQNSLQQLELYLKLILINEYEKLSQYFRKAKSQEQFKQQIFKDSNKNEISIFFYKNEISETNIEFLTNLHQNIINFLNNNEFENHQYYINKKLDNVIEFQCDFVQFQHYIKNFINNSSQDAASIQDLIKVILQQDKLFFQVVKSFFYKMDLFIITILYFCDKDILYQINNSIVDQKKSKSQIIEDQNLEIFDQIQNTDLSQEVLQEIKINAQNVQYSENLQEIKKDLFVEVKIQYIDIVYIKEDDNNLYFLRFNFLCEENLYFDSQIFYLKGKQKQIIIDQKIKMQISEDNSFEQNKEIVIQAQLIKIDQELNQNILAQNYHSINYQNSSIDIQQNQQEIDLQPQNKSLQIILKFSEILYFTEQALDQNSINFVNQNQDKYFFNLFLQYYSIDWDQIFKNINNFDIIEQLQNIDTFIFIDLIVQIQGLKYKKKYNLIKKQIEDFSNFQIKIKNFKELVKDIKISDCLFIDKNSLYNSKINFNINLNYHISNKQQTFEILSIENILSISDLSLLNKNDTHKLKSQELQKIDQKQSNPNYKIQFSKGLPIFEIGYIKEDLYDISVQLLSIYGYQQQLNNKHISIKIKTQKTFNIFDQEIYLQNQMQNVNIDVFYQEFKNQFQKKRLKMRDFEFQVNLLLNDQEYQKSVFCQQYFFQNQNFCKIYIENFYLIFKIIIQNTNTELEDNFEDKIKQQKQCLLNKNFDIDQFFVKCYNKDLLHKGYVTIENYCKVCEQLRLDQFQLQDKFLLNQKSFNLQWNGLKNNMKNIPEGCFFDYLYFSIYFIKLQIQNNIYKQKIDKNLLKLNLQQQFIKVLNFSIDYIYIKFEKQLQQFPNLYLKIYNQKSKEKKTQIRFHDPTPQWNQIFSYQFNNSNPINNLVYIEVIQRELTQNKNIYYKDILIDKINLELEDFLNQDQIFKFIQNNIAQEIQCKQKIQSDQIELYIQVTFSKQNSITIKESEQIDYNALKSLKQTLQEDFNQQNYQQEYTVSPLLQSFIKNSLQKAENAQDIIVNQPQKDFYFKESCQKDHLIFQMNQDKMFQSNSMKFTKIKEEDLLAKNVSIKSNPFQKCIQTIYNDNNQTPQQTESIQQNFQKISEEDQLDSIDLQQSKTKVLTIQNNYIFKSNKEASQKETNYKQQKFVYFNNQNENSFYFDKSDKFKIQTVFTLQMLQINQDMNDYEQNDIKFNYSLEEINEKEEEREHFREDIHKNNDQHIQFRTYQEQQMESQNYSDNIKKDLKNLSKEYFTEKELQRIKRLMKTQKIQDDFFDFDSDFENQLIH